MTGTTHPTFTLRFGELPHILADGVRRQDRWLLESTDPTWTIRNSGMGNINSLDHLGWAKEWAYSQLEEFTTYGITGWIDPDDDDREPFWVPRLVHVTHTYTIVDTDNDVMTYTAESRRDAEDVNDRLLIGSQYIRLRDT
jgi:hypothetical protein